MEHNQVGRGTDGAATPASRPSALRRLGLPAAALSLALGAAQVAAAAPSFAATPSGNVAVGHAPALPKGSVAAAAPAASTTLHLDVALNTGHAADLSAYAAGVGNRNSPYYHRYLSPSQVAEHFGASQAEISAVEAALKAQGLSVGSVSADGMFVSASGTVAQAEHAFNVSIKGYSAAGRSFYANTTAPTVAASISGYVSSIAGLDDSEYAVPQYAASKHHASLAGSKGSATSNVSSGYTVGTCSGLVSSLSSAGLTNGTNYFTYDALAKNYGMTSQITGGDDGAGVTVAVFELGPYDPTGVAQLDSCYGHSTSVTGISIDKASTTGGASASNDATFESNLDIETVANLAPGVKILDYVAPNSDAGVVDDYSAIINQDKAQVVSTSWGLCEADAASSTVSQENTLFQQAAAQGQTVLSASGDYGSTECYNDGSSSTALAVQDPSSQPYVTGVGGTTMQGLSNPTETTWNSSWINGSNTTSYGASGGGPSSTWAQPSYQSGLSPFGYTGGKRMVPDVSANADVNTGYAIDIASTAGNASTDGIYIAGGTSAAAPLWAAVIALADANTNCRLNGEAGFINPSLYTAGEGSSSSSVFRDVTSGNNEMTGIGATSGYAAGTGYDMATGWGSPLSSGVASTVCQTPIASTGSYYQADGPVRLLDTRAKFQVGTVTGPIAVNGTVKVQITGNSLETGTGISEVPAGATAAVLNVTATQPTGGGNATVYPVGEAMPLTSNLNFSAGQTTPNLVVVPLKSSGAVDITNNSTGTVQFIADLEGYYTTTTSSTTAAYTPVTPIRALDTRSGGNGVAKGKLAFGQKVQLQVGGATITAIGGTATQAIPSNITGVAMNVTVTNVTGGGFLDVYPNESASGTVNTTVPNASNLNFSAGQTVPNMVMVPVGQDGIVDFYNGAISGSTDVIADIAGYYTAGTNGDVYHPLGPVRLVDTRIGEGTTSVSPIAAKGTLNLALPSSYDAVIANVTVTQPTAGGFLNAYPLGGSLPNVSNLNFGTGQTIPNLAIVQSKSGVTFYNNASGTVHLIVDVSGYFSAS
ncbi:MAG TPA: S53 family peptidase [Actinospica sp.]|nr:S53 family peptidase [Actinospica sp.]